MGSTTVAVELDALARILREVEPEVGDTSTEARLDLTSQLSANDSDQFLHSCG